MPHAFAKPALLALVLAFAVAPALADPLADSIAAIDPSIREIRVPGGWEKDGRKGLYRVVLSRTADGTSHLFVQWLTLGPDGTPALERSIEIGEVAAQKLVVADFTADTDNGLTVFVTIANPTGDDPASYELIVEDDGTYRFDPASN